MVQLAYSVYDLEKEFLARIVIIQKKNQDITKLKTVVQLSREAESPRLIEERISPMCLIQIDVYKLITSLIIILNNKGRASY